MVDALAKHFNVNDTPQTQPIPGENQIKNSAGGYSYELDKWGKLDRLLILGIEGGTFYIKESELTVKNAENAIKCIKEDGARVVKLVEEISLDGRAPKNGPSLFVLALCCSLKFSTVEVRKLALSKLNNSIARISTHLFQFLNYYNAVGGGFGRSVNRTLQNWYLGKEPDKLAYQVVKYRQRENWTHRDVLRLCKPKTADKNYNSIFKWVTKNILEENNVPKIIKGFEKIQSNGHSVKKAVSLITDYKLPREAIPTELLKTPEIWDALLQEMPVMATVRNLGNMSKVGLLKPLSKAAKIINERLNDVEALKKSRIHPLQILAALNTYAAGHGFRGSGTWNPVQSVIDSLDDAFYKTFKNVVPSGERIVIALDVSASMDWGSIANVGGITPRIGSAALAMVTAQTEPNHVIIAFSHQMVKVDISKKKRLDDVVKHISNISMGGTDCALPMKWALTNEIEVDKFVVFTDNETWCSKPHPSQALRKYRKKFNIPAKLIVVGMTANEFTIADPEDSGMLDVVGFDTSVPKLISDF